MTDKIEVSKPVEIKDNSVERVAFDLMEKIAHNERFSMENANPNIASDQATRFYWLNLYAQCLKAAQGYGPVNAQKVN